MHNGSLYRESNSVQRQDAKRIIDQFVPDFQWRSDGRDSLLDIGCGSGDVTIDYLLPLMPTNFTRIVGVDVSEGMLQQAKDTYSHPKITFEHLDIERPLDSKMVLLAPFDHVTSFYCLHWVKNQKQAFQNIYDLLVVGGDCLHVILASHPLLDLFHELPKQPRWAPYVSNMMISPYHFSTNPEGDLTGILREIGFTDYNYVQIHEKMFSYDGPEILLKSVRSIASFFDRMPAELQTDFMDIYLELLRSKTHGLPRTNDNEILMPYKLLVVYARK